jgi:hypothetical protein
VQAQERRASLAFVHEVSPPVAELDVMGREAKAGEIGEALVGGAHA